VAIRRFLGEGAWVVITAETLSWASAERELGPDARFVAADAADPDAADVDAVASSVRAAARPQ
jgi:NAD(P)-dependent dehydrogenase (short-subunit alcohol dehydrogenase family)